MEAAPLRRPQYQQAILYFLHHCNTPQLGKTKLLKLLYYLDFDHFERYDTPVTGDTYRKLMYGPVPDHAEEILSDMEAQGLITHTRERVLAYEQDRYTPKRKVDLSVFSESECAVLEAVCARWRHATRHAIVEATHQEAPWMAVEEREAIPYVYAYYRNRERELDIADEEGGYLSPDDLLATAG